MSFKNILRKTGKLYDFLVKMNYSRSIKKNERITQKKGLDGIKIIISKSMTDLVGYKPNLDDPHTFNEKMQWLKLFWYDEKVRVCCDKNTVREYIKSKGLDEILINQIAVFNNVDEIDYNSLPNEFVLKPSHDSGHTYICTNKDKFDCKKVNSELKKWLKYDYTFRGMEWGYHITKPTIVCEELIKPANNKELYDYKFFCFNGEPKYIFFVSDRFDEAKSDFYDLNWNLQDFRWYYEPSKVSHSKPECLDKMIEYAKILSKDFPFVRVDFYESDGRIYFGELTFFHGSGYGWFKPFEIDEKFGEMITLPLKSKINPWQEIGIIKKDY